MVEETRAEKIARLQREKDAEAAAARESEEIAKLEGLELEAQYRKELGKLGQDFAMVDASAFGAGFIVVKLGADLAFRRYVDAVHKADGAPDAEDVFAFVSPAVVHPSAEEFAAITRKRGHLLNRSADALASLHGVRQKRVEGKF